MCPNFGTPKIILHLEQIEILLFLGVPILRHFRVINFFTLVVALARGVHESLLSIS